MADVPRSNETSPPLPEPFGRYRIIKRLGQGGMGAVYLAEDTQLGRRVALKVPELGAHDGPEARERFYREARAAATLDHPYLCPVYDVGEIAGHLYLTMAYIEGKSLAESIGGGGMPSRQVAKLVGKLALGMEEAHVKGVIHRDLKPANIMLKETSRGREPVIVDFGLARRDHPDEVRVTKSGQVMGTISYMAPEQIRGDANEIGPRCDIYALGIILYELLTGQLPFDGTWLAAAGQILTQEPLHPSTHRGDLDPQLEAICLKAMAKKVGDRYASMNGLAVALTDCLRASSASATPSTPAVAPAYAATLLETEADQQMVRPKKAAVSPGAESRWESMIEVRETESSTEAKSKPTRRGRPLWVWPSLAAGAVVVALLVAWVAGRFKVEDKEITNTIGMKLVLIPAGEFLMGSPGSDKDAFVDEKPQHPVRITRPFYLGATEVTQGQYQAVMGENPSRFRGSVNLPVEQVTWDDAIAYCNKLTELENGELGAARYRLPTEAEWEYACRAGGKTPYTFGDDAVDLDEFAWYGGNSGGKTHPVGEKRSNDFKLYDMHGNVWEWCRDSYEKNYYDQSPDVDPVGPPMLGIRVRRGGGCGDNTRDCRSAIRYGGPPIARGTGLGFRVARTLSNR